MRTSVGAWAFVALIEVMGYLLFRMVLQPRFDRRITLSSNSDRRVATRPNRVIVAALSVLGGTAIAAAVPNGLAAAAIVALALGFAGALFVWSPTL